MHSVYSHSHLLSLVKNAETFSVKLPFSTRRYHSPTNCGTSGKKFSKNIHILSLLILQFILMTYLFDKVYAVVITRSQVVTDHYAWETIVYFIDTVLISWSSVLLTSVANVLK